MADEYDGIYRGLTAASFRHMAVSYRCRDAVGTSPYRDARVTAENALRLAGIPTDTAMREVRRMVVKVERGSMKSAPVLSLHACIKEVRDTLSTVQAWQAKVTLYWQQR